MQGDRNKVTSFLSWSHPSPVHQRSADTSDKTRHKSGYTYDGVARHHGTVQFTDLQRSREPFSPVARPFRSTPTETSKQSILVAEFENFLPTDDDRKTDTYRTADNP